MKYTSHTTQNVIINIIHSLGSILIPCASFIGEDDIESYSVSNYGSKDNCHQPHRRYPNGLRDSEERCSSNEADDALCSEASYMWTGTSKDTIRAIQTRAHSISAVFAKLCK